jgi:hypothetical protein
MVGGIDRNNAIPDLRVLVAQIPGKLRLCAGRADDQDLAGVADGIHHLRKKLLVEPDMPATYRVSLVVDVPPRLVWEHGNFVIAGQTNMKDLGLRMVDPDDRVEMDRHVRVLVGARTMTMMRMCIIKGYRKCSFAG